MGRSAEKASEEKKRQEQLRESPEETGMGDAGKMLVRTLRESAEKCRVGGGPARREEAALDRFSSPLLNGVGVEGLRMPITQRQFRSLQNVFNAAQIKLLRGEKTVSGVRFDYGTFKVTIPGVLVQDVGGAELRIEYLRGGRDTAREALGIIREAFDSVLRREKQKQGA